jgi:hypothetical protein
MGAPAAGASISSIASLAFGAAGSLAKGFGTQAADEFQADRATRAAELGRTQAALTDVTYRENLNTTLGNIDAIRAAAHIDPTSPTTAALRDYNTMISDRQRMAAVGSLRQQAAEDEAGAAYLRKAGWYAVNMGLLEAGTKVAGGVAMGFGGPGGSSKSNSVGNPTRLGSLY